MADNKVQGFANTWAVGPSFIQALNNQAAARAAEQESTLRLGMVSEPRRFDALMVEVDRRQAVFEISWQTSIPLRRCLQTTPL